MVVVGGALGAVLAGWVLQSFSKELYPSKAQLVLAPPKLPTYMAPDPMTLQGYQSLLESPEVLSETSTRLRREGVIGDHDRLDLGDELATSISTASRSEEPLSSILEVQAVWSDPEGAARIANTWVAVFLERTRERRRSTTLAALESVERQYPEARRQEREVQSQIGALSTELRGDYDAVLARWETRIQKARLETRNLFGELERSVLDGVPGDPARSDAPAQGSSLLDVLLELIATRCERAQLEPPNTPTPRMVEPVAAPILANRSGDAREPSSELAPAYVMEQKPLVTSDAASSVEVVLTGRIALLEGELARRSSAAGADGADAVRALSRRSAELEGERQMALATLLRQRNRELASLEVTAQQRMIELAREAARLQQLGALLADGSNQAALARQQLDLDEIHVASQAIPPDRPKSSQRTTRALLGAFAGLLLAVVLGVLIEARRGFRSRTDSA